jgi:hypothetical protein
MITQLLFFAFCLSTLCLLLSVPGNGCKRDYTIQFFGGLLMNPKITGVFCGVGVALILAALA